MQKRSRVRFAYFALFRGTISLLLLGSSSQLFCEVPLAAVKAFDEYTAKAEARLAQQHRFASTFLVEPGPKRQNEARLRQGELIIERVTPDSEFDPPRALLHHWRGTAFVPGATAAQFECMMKNFSAYPRVFSPEVLQARILSPRWNGIPDRFTALMRVRQKHVITVVLETTYDITYGRLDPRHGYSISRSTRIDEIASPETPKEHALPATGEHGFLWRLNTYWSYEERDGGLYIQIESISLTRAIPTGLGWAVGPYVESVPHESLEFTLRSTSNALKSRNRENGR
jgi:hypothetical protein